MVRTPVTHLAAPPVPRFFLSTFWRHLWSVTEQKHDKMELFLLKKKSRAHNQIAKSFKRKFIQEPPPPKKKRFNYTEDLQLENI